MPNFDRKRLPPVTSILGRACYECFKFKDKDRDVPLKQCSRCLAVQYCSPECQKAHWKSDHKEMCNALRSLENDTIVRMALLSALSNEHSSDPDVLNATIGAMVNKQIAHLVRLLDRNLTTEERNLLAWEPRCIGCARTDRIMRMEAVAKGSGFVPRKLTPCPTCKMDFYCSNHRDTIQRRHAGEPCDGGHDGLSQCQMNQEIRGGIAFSSFVAKANVGQFRWSPEHIKSSWVSLKGTSWEAEYTNALAEHYRLPSNAVAPLVRAASEGLSMPMTILWALEHLNTDDSWTRKNTLIIHLLGAEVAELTNDMAFEEILRRLPEIKCLKLVLCGPELDQVSPHARNQEFDVDTCRRRRTKVRKIVAQTYHNFAKSQGRNFIKPDLAIAFNSGLSQVDIQLWKPTISFLVKNNIPSIFTAYNQDEAEAEAQLLLSDRNGMSGEARSLRKSLSK